MTPTQFGRRLVGAVVMLEGTAFIAIVTAAITSTSSSGSSVSSSPRRVARSPDGAGDRLGTSAGAGLPSAVGNPVRENS